MKKMIIKSSILLALVINLSASEFKNAYEKAYIDFSGLSKKEVHKIVKYDKDYIKASKYVFDKEYKKDVTINIADPELQKGQVIKKVVKTADYNNALKYYEKSVRQKNNPVAAYSGIYIVNNYTNKMDIKNLKKFVLFANALYNQEVKICQSYLYYGESLERGYLQKKDFKKALAVYDEGIKDSKCQSGWISTVLFSKKLSLERKINSKKSK